MYTINTFSTRRFAKILSSHIAKTVINGFKAMENNLEEIGMSEALNNSGINISAI